MAGRCSCVYRCENNWFISRWRSCGPHLNVNHISVTSLNAALPALVGTHLDLFHFRKIIFGWKRNFHVELCSVCFRSSSGLHWLHHVLIKIGTAILSMSEASPLLFYPELSFSLLHLCTSFNHPHTLFVDIVMKWWPNTGAINGVTTWCNDLVFSAAGLFHKGPKGPQNLCRCKRGQLQPASIPLCQIVTLTWSFCSLYLSLTFWFRPLFCDSGTL